MCNCNQKRAAYTAELSSSEKGMVKVKLIKNNPMVINGDVTGRTYIFNALNEVVTMDKRDVPSISGYAELQVL